MHKTHFNQIRRRLLVIMKNENSEPVNMNLG